MVSSTSSWPDLFRPSTSVTSVFWRSVRDVDARDKRGHDDSIKSHFVQLHLPAVFLVSRKFVSILTIMRSVPTVWRRGQLSFTRRAGTEMAEPTGDKRLIEMPGHLI